MFYRNQLVRHVKSGRIYTIVQTPFYCMIEANTQPAYAYQAVKIEDGEVRCDSEYPTQWVRAQQEMEDGRFVPVTQIGGPILVGEPL